MTIKRIPINGKLEYDKSIDDSLIYQYLSKSNKYDEFSTKHFKVNLDLMNSNLIKKSNKAIYSINLPNKFISAEDETFESFIKNNNIDVNYVNENAHRISGPYITMKYNKNFFNNLNGKLSYYYLNNKKVFEEEFADETKHILCKYCNDFCKQGCFYE